MSRFFLPLIFLTATLSFSCASPNVKVLAPELEKIYTKKGENIGGIVVYNPHGPERLENARRNQAKSRMREICGEKSFSITKEENARPAERVEKYRNQPELLGGRTIRFIDFKCID